MPDLQALSLAELKEMLRALTALEEVGEVLIDMNQLTPVFHLMPGAAMGLTIDARMPEGGTALAAMPAAGVYALGPELIRPDGWPGAQPETDLPEDTTKPAPGLQQAASPTAAAEVRESDGGGGLAAPAPAVAPVDEMLGGEREGLQRHSLAEQDPVQAAADGEDKPDPAAAEAQPEAPAPGTARALAAAIAKATVWTEAEDQRLIELLVTGICTLGLSQAAAIREAADQLGRPEPGTAFRCRNKLKDRLAAALADAARSKAAAPAPAEAVTHDPAPAPPPAASGADGRSPVQRHLDDLPRAAGWTLALDADLLRLAIAGMGMADIAAELDLRAADVRTRFDLLTGYHKIDEGERSTWHRRFAREDVLAELDARLEAEQRKWQRDAGQPRSSKGAA